MTQQRETQKHFVEAYQKLYAPILVDVFMFFDMRTHPRRGHDVNPEDEQRTLSRVVEHIGNNLIYATPSLTRAYHQSSISGLSDETGFFPRFSDLALLLTFLNELNQVVVSARLFGMKSSDPSITEYRIKYLAWHILSAKVRNTMRAADMLSASYWFDKKSLTEGFYKELQKYESDKYSGEDFTNLVAVKLLTDPDMRQMLIDSAKENARLLSSY